MSVSGVPEPRFLVDSDGNPVGVLLDGSVYRLQSLGKILNASGSQINPATQETLSALEGKDFATQTTLATLSTEAKLETVRALLATIDADTSQLDVALSTRASEATLAAADTKLGTIDAVLDAIKDTAGVKKITDALPTGDNWIGRAKVGDGTNVVTVVQDGSAYRLQTEATIGQPSPTAIRQDQCKNGGSDDLRVDGSGTPVTFTFPADGTDDLALTSVQIVMSADAINMDGSSFGKGSALSTGLQLKLTLNNGVDVVTLLTALINEAFTHLPQFDLFQGGVKDLMLATFNFPARVLLVGGSSDKVEVIINDDLTSGALGLAHFVCTVTATEE